MQPSPQSVLKCFHHLQKKLQIHLQIQHFPSFPFNTRKPLIYFLCICLLWKFHIDRIMQYVDFLMTGFSQHNAPRQGSSMLHHISVLHSFLFSNNIQFYQFSSVQSLSCVRFLVIPWTAAHQASLSITNSRSLVKLVSIQFYRHTLFHPSIQPLMGIWIISTFWSLWIMLLWTLFYR